MNVYVQLCSIMNTFAKNNQSSSWILMIGMLLNEKLDGGSVRIGFSTFTCVLIDLGIVLAHNKETIVISNTLYEKTISGLPRVLE